MKLILAEKKDAAKMMAAALSIKTKDQGGYFENGNYIVTWAQGHLIETCHPEYYDKTYKKWSLDHLPIIPPELATKPAKQHNKKIKLIKGLINKSSQVINACDCGQEGELIARLIFKHCGFNKPHKRLWYTSLVPSEIKRAISDLKNSSDFDALYTCAWFRNYLDWTFGINLTRAFTLKLSGSDGVINTGRVTTPTLNELVERQLEIDNFKPEPYSVLTFEKEPFKFTSERFVEAGPPKEQFKQFTVTKSEQKEVTTKPHKLFSLNTLQKEANKLFGFKAKKTLELAEKLYLAGLISYPRSESEHLPENFDLAYIKQIFSKNGHSFELDTNNKRIFDTSKIEDHHAVIPTPQYKPIEVNDEKNLYLLILKRFLSAFAQDSKSLSIKLEGESKGICFKSSKSFITYRGFKEIYDQKSEEKDTEEDEPILTDKSSLTVPQESDSFEISPDLEERATKPPPHYTDASLISFMQNAGRVIDEKLVGGIGTVATRAQIIAKLESSNFIIYKGKKIIATGKAITTISHIPFEEIKKPYLTLELEKLFGEIKSGSKGFNDCRKVSDDKLSDLFKEVMKIKQLGSGQESDFGCPICGKNLIKSKYSYLCPEHEAVSIPHTLLGKKLSKEEISALLSGGTTNLIKGFKGKKNKFDAILFLDPQTYKIKFKFPNERQPAADFDFDKTCPVCHQESLKLGKYGIYCSGPCSGKRPFSVPNRIKDTNISEENMLLLLNGEKTCLISFKSGKGGYKARLFFKEDQTLGFEFQN